MPCDTNCISELASYLFVSTCEIHTYDYFPDDNDLFFIGFTILPLREYWKFAIIIEVGKGEDEVKPFVEPFV